MRFRIANPTASLYNNRTQVLAALEFACLDILGQAWGVPVHAILGGKLRDRVPFASYCFFRYADSKTGKGEVRTIDQVVANARALKERFGFTSHIDQTFLGLKMIVDGGKIDLGLGRDVT